MVYLSVFLIDAEAEEDLILIEAGLEMIWLELHMNRRSVLLGNIYRPPHADVNASKDLGEETSQ